MSRIREKVVVAMSGGVDSSVAACLLVEQGYEVVGLFMRSGVKAAGEPSPLYLSLGGRGGSEEPSPRPSPWEGEGERGEDHALALATRRSDPARTQNPPQSPLGKGGGKNHALALEARTSADGAGAACETATRSHPTTRPHQGCCSASDAADARFVAGKLGIPFYALNFEEEFESLIDYFVDEYARGRTPNPCVVCNNKLKFGKIVEYADAVGARYIATGHYARVERTESELGAGSEGPSPLTLSLEGRGESGEPLPLPLSLGGRGESVEPSPLSLAGRGGREERSPRPSPWEGEGERRARTRLLRGVDRAKDQSYVLFGLERAVLDRVLFPIGHLTKPEVREIAARYDLPNRDKPDSVEICFVPDRNYARLVRERRPEAFGAGDVVEAGTGRLLGRHEGVPNYTVGQRRGLRIAAGVPIYVTELNADTSTVVVGRDEALLQDGLSLERVNLLVNPPTDSFRALVKIRYQHSGAAGMVRLLEGKTARVEFEEPQRAISPGQAAVFYEGDTVLGGGWIAGG